jgi:Ca2+:H+ antiporter
VWLSIADLLLLGIPVALWAEYFGHQPMIAFIASAIAVLRLAAWMGHATEEVAIHAGPRIGGFLNGTFGNAAELIIVILAIKEGLFEVVKASITGSILGNSLLVLGAASLTGGLKYTHQQFNRNLARFNSSLLFIAMAALVVPAIFHHGNPVPMTESGLRTLSLWTAIILLGVYVASLVFSFKTHAHLFVAEGGLHEKAKWSLAKAMGVLLAATLGVVFMSEVLVKSLEPVLHTLGWSELFVGIVVVALVGNAAEHSTAVTMAMQNRMEVAVEIAIGSTTQIALLVAPVAVLVSHLFGPGMSLEFLPSELVAILVSVLTVNQITRDGETNWLEGLMLLAAYTIIAVAFYFVPAH